MEMMTIPEFLEQSSQIAKREGISHLDAILFNIKHLEVSIKNNAWIIKGIRTVAPLVEKEIRPLKIELRARAKLPMTEENRKALSTGGKKLYLLRGTYHQSQIDLKALRTAVRKDCAGKKIAVDALREYYRLNPETPNNG